MVFQVQAHPGDSVNEYVADAYGVMVYAEIGIKGVMGFMAEQGFWAWMLPAFFHSDV